MNYRTLAVSVLALGLLAPVGAMAHNINNNCSEEEQNRKEFVDCISPTSSTSEQFGAGALMDDALGTDEGNTRNNLGDSDDKINN